METVTVIVPVHNVEAYLSEAVESILCQTYRDLEILLIDDGSTDGSGALCDRFAERDARVKVIHQSNAGVAAARNTGLDRARGKYVAFIDSDDFIAPEMFETMLGCMSGRGGVRTCVRRSVRLQKSVARSGCGDTCLRVADDRCRE